MLTHDELYEMGYYQVEEAEADESPTNIPVPGGEAEVHTESSSPTTPSQPMTPTTPSPVPRPADDQVPVDDPQQHNSLIVEPVGCTTSSEDVTHSPTSEVTSFHADDPARDELVSIAPRRREIEQLAQFRAQD